MQFPKFIALCGNPSSGKTTAAELLCDDLGYELVDDGLPLREIGQNYFGLTWEQCHTQEGKKEKILLNGREYEAREILGEIGDALERKFGENIMPVMVLNRHHDDFKDPSRRFVFGSVRRNQGLFWRSMGALVLEINNPSALPSPYYFDQYNRAPIHESVFNDGTSRALFRDRLVEAVYRWRPDR